MISIINIAGIYILIKILYIFNRTPDSEDKDSDISEIDTKNMKNKKNISLREKDFLSINKKKSGKKAKKSYTTGFDKNSDMTPSSSSGEKMKTTHGNFDNKSSEIEDSEENEDSNKNKDIDTSNDDSDKDNDNEKESDNGDDGSSET